MECTMPDEVAHDDNDVSASRLPPSLVEHLVEHLREYLDRTDEQLAKAAWLWWLCVQLEARGIPLDRATLADAERIRIATFASDTDNQALAGLEKAFLLIAAWKPENLPRAGRMIRDYISQSRTQQATQNELATGHLRQSELGRRKRRPSYLYTRVAEMVEAQHDIETPEVLRRLERLVEQEAHLDPRMFPRMERVDRTEDDGKGVIEWSEPNPRRRGKPRGVVRDGQPEREPLTKSAHTAAIPHMLSRIRKKLAINRPKKSKSR
jgi:hypothetical protein